MTQKINEQYKKQWSKIMYSFFDYLPTKYEASKQEWKIRKLVWDFKDGKRSLNVAKIVAQKLREQFGAHTNEIVFACIPAATSESNKIRYEVFASEVCRMAGTQNAFNNITVSGTRLAVHETRGSKVVSNVQVIDFNKRFFKGKKVLIFDDVLTQGYSYARFACALENCGAEVIGGYFLGKTLLK